MIKIVIDFREKKLIELFKLGDIKCEILNLEIGDIHIYENDNTKYIIERKTITDLSASIIDGRYREQKARLMNNFSLDKILYIIENDSKCKKRLFKHFDSTLLNLQLRDNIHLIQTVDIKHTFTVLKLLLDKLNQNKLKNDKIDEINIQHNYCNTIKLQKKQNLTPENYYLLVLAQIPGISIIIASAIQNKYNTLKELMNTYQMLLDDTFFEKEENIKRCEKLCSDIEYGTTKKRRIGKISKKIFDYLFFIKE